MADDKQAPNAPAMVYSEYGKTVVAGFVSVEPKQSRTVTVSYLLPLWLEESVKNQRQYSFLWQKQPGTNTKVEFIGESQESLYSFAPSQLSYKLENPRRIRVQDTLDTDQVFTLNLAP